MGESLYHLLGVDRNADDASIRRAYRERVKDHHPDVSDDPDAVDEFKRLTAARDVLLDDQARARYDRLGHEAYAATELEPDLWPPTSDHSAPNGPGSSSEGDADTSHVRETVSGYSGDTAAGSAHSRVVGASATAASGSPWNSQTARHEYTPTGVPTETLTAVDRVRAGLRSLGPWVVVHAVFLATAAGAAGMLTAGTGSVAALSLTLGAGFFGLALFLSALHVVSMLYV